MSSAQLSVTSPTSQLILILQAFCHFTYVTAHSPTLQSLYLRHNSFSNPSLASPMSQFILQPFFRFYVTGFSLMSPGEPPMLRTCLWFLLLLSLLVMVYQIQPSNDLELQKHSTLSNNTSVTTYDHRMIISSPSLFKHMKNDEHVAMLFQCLLYHTDQKCTFVSFCCWEIRFQRVYTSIWDTLYINLQ